MPGEEIIQGPVAKHLGQDSLQVSVVILRADQITKISNLPEHRSGENLLAVVLIQFDQLIRGHAACQPESKDAAGGSPRQKLRAV